MTVVTELFDLQEIDLALDRGRARLEEIDEALQESDELIEARQARAEKEGVLGGFRERQKDIEWEVDEVRAKAIEMEAKLYGGTVRNPKELSDLDTDVRSLKGQASKREDALLALMEEAEGVEAEFREADSTYRQIEAAWQAHGEELLGEKAEIEPQMARLEAQRAQQAEAIDRASLGLYQLLRERRGGQAVAHVERGMCQGCRITLPMSVLQKARAGIGLVQCVSCERVLLVN